MELMGVLVLKGLKVAQKSHNCLASLRGGSTLSPGYEINNSCT